MRESNYKTLKNGLRTWIEIDRKAVKNNYQTFRSVISKDCRLMSVVKSNAYGHGLVDFSKEMEKLGIDWLGVDSIVEGLALRREGIKKPILVLGNTLSERVREAAEKNISVTVSSFDSLKKIEKLKLPKPLKVHIKVDTGMHRQGFLPQDLEKVLRKFQTSKTQSPTSNFQPPTSNLQLEGLYTHFAAAKNPASPKHTLGQIAEFQEWIEAFRDAGFKPIVHASATSGTLLFSQAHFDMVRVGIGMYGLWPSKEVEGAKKREVKLKPALSWHTLVGEIKTLPKGSKLGYDLTEETKRKTTIAICPVGYWHGYPRSLSSIGRVLVGGKPCRVLGRVSMDMIVVDITNSNKNRKVKVGDEVVILGRQNRSEIKAGDLAESLKTTNYEIVTRINPLIKRIYV